MNALRFPGYLQKNQLVEIPFNGPRMIKDRVRFIQKLRDQEGIQRAVIGLSGGMDSSVVLELLILALGPENVFPRMLPNGKAGATAVRYAKMALEFTRIPKKNVRIIDIEPLVTPFVEILKANDNIRRGNIAARVRMAVLFDQASKLTKQSNILTVPAGTENKTERLFGYCTVGGDQVSIFEAIQGLYKTQVFHLARELNTIREAIIQRPPSADLWKNQTDEGELGVGYQIADQILYLMEQGYSRSAIRGLGFSRKAVDCVYNRVKQYAFKSNIPYTFETYGK